MLLIKDLGGLIVTCAFCVELNRDTLSVILKPRDSYLTVIKVIEIDALFKWEVTGRNTLPSEICSAMEDFEAINPSFFLSIYHNTPRNIWVVTKEANWLKVSSRCKTIESIEVFIFLRCTRLQNNLPNYAKKHLYLKNKIEMLFILFYYINMYVFFI